MVLISEHLPHTMVSQLQRYGYETVSLPSDPRLAPAVSSHPDMLVFVTETSLITDQIYYTEMAREQLDRVCRLCGLTLITTNAPPRAEYPHDIRFNAARVGNYLFCHPTHTSPLVLNDAAEHGRIIVPTKQGYAGCSSCPVGEEALITADPSILRAARQKKDLDVLSIHQGHISLPGYSHGFIGGCCGYTQDSIFFCGNLSHHPDGKIMREFIRNHGHQTVELSDEPLFDGGSLIFIPRQSRE